MTKIITAAEAALLINDGDTVAITGFGLSCMNEETLIALEQRFLATGSPRGLTTVHSSAVGDRRTKGMDHLAHAGFVKRWIGGIASACPHFARLMATDGIEGYNWPQGVITTMYREIAAGRPGVITKVGIGTFVDPRLNGSKVTAAATEDLVELIDLAGEEYLFFKRFPIDIGLIRATAADELGNLTMTHESLRMEVLPVAQAAHNCGGLVIAQVESVAQAHSIGPNDVKVPGFLIDYVVVSSPENHFQTENTRYNPAFSGQLKIPPAAFAPLALSERKVIARRAAMEMKPGGVVNFGIGIPAEVGIVLSEEGVSEQAILTTEAGAVGGTPAGLPDFGSAYNPEALVDMDAQFDFYDGGGLDLAVLGFAQVNAEGSVNVSKFGGVVAGCGGFINIAQTAKTLVFAGTLTAGGLETIVGEGRIEIISEGRSKKYVGHLEHVTFSGPHAAEQGQTVYYVTERAAFKLLDGSLTLIEIAPGIELERDVLAQMDFDVMIAPTLGLMPSGLFRETWGGLAEIIARNG